MRSASIAVLREIGVETGGSNVQFAVDPKTGRMIVIEMNPRVSRSSALASKATGFPIAKVAAQAGGRLHARRDRQRHHRRRDPGELRADHRLCRDQDPALRLREVQGRRSHAVDGDEVGRRSDGDRPHLRRKPAEGAARAGDRACAGSTACASLRMPIRAEIENALARPTPDRLLVAAEALRQGFTVERIHADRRLRPVVPRAAGGNRRRRGAGARRGPAAGRRGDAAAEGDGLFRRAAGPAGAALGPCRRAR